MRLREALDTWVMSCAHLRPRTVYSLSRASIRWIAYFGYETELSDLIPNDIISYLERYRQGHAATTTNQERRYLAWFLNSVTAKSGDLLEGSPVFAEEAREPRCLTVAETDSLLAGATGELRVIILLALETGLRRQNLLDLRWEWITQDGWLDIPGSAMKGHHPLRVPLSPAALQALRELQAALSGRVFAMRRSWLSKRFYRLSQATHVNCTFHDLRRTFWTRARERGIPLEVCMRLASHRDVRTALRHYRSLSPDELLRAVGRGTEARRDQI